jgi:hypothetical protein
MFLERYPGVGLHHDGLAFDQRQVKDLSYHAQTGHRIKPIMTCLTENLLRTLPIISHGDVFAEILHRSYLKESAVAECIRERHGVPD